MWSTNAAALSCPTARSRRAVLIERGRDGKDSAAPALLDDGYEVEVCDRSAAALERLHAHPTDVVVINVPSPGLEALELRRAQRENPSLANVPIVLSVDGRLLQGRGLADMYVERPFGRAELLAAVDRALLERERRALAERLEKTERLALLGTIAAGVGHELNNPLAFSMGNYELAERALSGLLQAAQEPTSGVVTDGLSPEKFEAVIACLRAGRTGLDRVRRMVNRLADLARGTAGPHLPLSVQEVMDASIAMARAHIDERAELIRDYAPVDPVLGDEGRLGQVFVNLLVNAAQSIPPGHAASNCIRVATRTEGALVIVDVTDTGAGMSRTHLARIFEPFFTTKGEHGTGLGLPICQEIVAEHGGRLEVLSELGKGSRFTVRLPSALPDPVPPSRPFMS